MSTLEPLHVAFVWHMHQPYYRSAGDGAFGMPWVRMHGLKDYLSMVETLKDYPALHHTFNLVPSLVEQLEVYATGDFADVYWEHTIKPAAELDPGERAFVLERMCESSDHLRTRLHPRYTELARKREASGPPDWQACAAVFTVDELRDLQVWFNLSWFDPETLAAEPLRALVERGHGFTEGDKQALAAVQADVLARVLPAYRDAARRGQIELSTSPYFHPILPLLCNSDSARVASSDMTLPPYRFAHPDDAAEQVTAAVEKHLAVFGEAPRGMWCSEQAVGEDVLPLLAAAGISWTISDETVLARSLSGAAPPTRRGADDLTAGRPSGGTARPVFGSPYFPYLLSRGEDEVAIVFRDHTLSDLIGFTYRSWAPRDAATDLIRRLHELRTSLASGSAVTTGAPRLSGLPLVTVALDGENAWEYYPGDGRDFLRYLYEGLASDDSLACVTISEHLRSSPAVWPLDWLHTGSWIGGDLRTWCGDKAHNRAWEQLSLARDFVARHQVGPIADADSPGHDGRGDLPAPATARQAWQHILVTEGSDWFWWFGDHHHTTLDHVWDEGFRAHLREAYRLLGGLAPAELLFPLLEESALSGASPPRGPLSPSIDGVISNGHEWADAGRLASQPDSTMHRGSHGGIGEIRYGWGDERLCLLLVPEGAALRPGLRVEVRASRPEDPSDVEAFLVLQEGGGVDVTFAGGRSAPEGTLAAWADVVEAVLPMDVASSDGAPQTAGVSAQQTALRVRAVFDESSDQVFYTAGLAALGKGER